MNEAIGLLLAFILTGLILVGAGMLMLRLARRSDRGQLARNQIAGVRTPLTLSSDTAWYSAQRAAAPRTSIAGWGAIVGGLAVIALGVVGFPIPVAMAAYMVVTFAAAAWLIGWVLAAGASAQRAAQDAVGP